MDVCGGEQCGFAGDDVRTRAADARLGVQCVGIQPTRRLRVQERRHRRATRAHQTRLDPSHQASRV